jgi:hypothetical protein
MMTEELGITHVSEHEIQLKDLIPAGLPLYGLVSPKMKFPRKHMGQLLEDGLLVPTV